MIKKKKKKGRVGERLLDVAGVAHHGTTAEPGLTDYCKVDMLGSRYKSVNFRAKPFPASPNRADRMSV